MKLSLQQLSSHLRQNFLPAYLVAGDEPLLVQEAADVIRLTAQKNGYEECLRFTVDNNFDWSLFREAIMGMSLFSDRQIIVLRFLSNKLGDVGGKALQAYLEQPSPDKKLLLIANKLDAAAQKTLWFKTLNRVGAFLPIWPLPLAQMPGWIQQRLQSVRLSADPAAVSLLAELTEGNLFATAQMIERLGLLYPQGRLTIEHVREVGADNARFNVFDLVDKILQRDPLPILHALTVLREQAVEPVLVLWAITRELRELIKLKHTQGLSQGLNTQNLWNKRQPLMVRLLSLHSEKTLYALLQRAARIDLLIKGMAVGSVWDELSSLVLSMAGIDIGAANDRA